ncbi:sigma-54-dependent Fis family transcriptional regulator [Nitrogeniibacter mangrovi]|uniref:Sigma-54-dependent Fis family transcriptional regulator n=1 Tax=Nitrogeniibacter mangrovi TaxID=2016596 RepID=A0A6C1B0P6_9RHOO|nr:sigma-54-dependent Fis family transcriptional regulator [Nitrogeniibacter mangrovi]QID16398.1 sigma-54-dependent Fis family transcriptional regulator [Nitrogeniibacter mangrovi]
MFSRPENDRFIMNSWERLLSGERSATDAIRRLIDDSWNRCLHNQVDPGRTGGPEPVAEQSLYTLLNEHDELLSASTPIMAEARDFLSESGTVMVLTDNSGTILNMEGDTSTRGATENIHLMPGSDWSESACGTNAIGTALEIGQPIQIHAAEHFCAGIKRWTCSATVIRDPYDKSILGVIDVSGLNSTFNRHSLALVVTTSGRIENRLARMAMDMRYRLLEYCMRRLTSATSDGVVVLDRRGNPIKANERASSVLSDLADGQAADLSSLAFGPVKGSEMPTGLPPWIQADWLDPVFHNGHRIGTLLTLPGRSSNTQFSRPVVGEDVLANDGTFEQVVGDNPGLRQSVGKARQLAGSSVPVLILGETGVGKDVMARGIHKAGTTKDAPFVAINCGGFSRELLTSELFGYAEGAFTGARRGGMVGKVEAADGGTLFLDEIGEMPLDLQPHFLRVLEEGEVYRLGETKPRKVKFRLIAATNRDLRKEVEEGRFRMDLFYRVAVTSIRIPALRDRVDDIPVLADHYLEKLATQYGMPKKTITAGAMEYFKRYAWPGNIRELRNVLESMVLMTPDIHLSEEYLPHELSEVVDETDEGITCLESVEREAILRAIRGSGGNMTGAARTLGIAKSTLYVKLKRYNLDPLVDRVRGARV